MPGGTGRLLVRTPAFFPFRGEGGGGRGTEPVRYRGVVFGTLLGPEATGPGRGVFLCSGSVCFWFPGCTDHTVCCVFGAGVWGVWYGVVV